MDTDSRRLSSASPVVRLHAVAKRYRRRGRWVLCDVNLGVRPGSTIEVRGANGAGKSTLLRLLAGVTAPSRGRRRSEPRVRVGYAPDAFAPAPSFDAATYLRHHARMRGLGGEPARRATAELAVTLGLERLFAEPLREVSKGSLQKVVVAQALLGVPDLIILDEPFSGLDADAQRALRVLLRERAAAGAAVVFSDHHEGGARHAADAIWHLEDGRARVTHVEAAEPQPREP